MVNDMRRYGNYGVRLRLATEAHYACMFFASSNADNPNIRPKLVIEYTVPSAVTRTFTPQENGRVFSVYPTSPAPTASYFASQAWTWNGRPGSIRSLMKFDLSSIPAGAVITSAELKLYHHPVTRHSSRTRSNASYLERVTSSWNASSAQWNNQPSTTTMNRVYLPKSTNALQDYTLNVTGMVNDMHRFGNHGMRLRLATESHYACMFFASGNDANPNLRPKLVVTYR